MDPETIIKAPHFVRLLFNRFDEVSLAEQLQKLLFFYFSSFMMLGAMVWGFICLAYGLRMPSLIPFTYVILTLFNFIFSGTSAINTKIGCNIQVGASLMLPFIFQETLGGIAASGLVSLWAVLALLGSFILQNKRVSFIWLGLFVMMTMLSFYLESLRPEDIIFKVPIFLTSINMVLVSAMIFVLAQYFTTMQNKMASMFYKQKQEEKASNFVFAEELETARKFQKVFHSQNAKNLEAYKHFQINQNLNGLTGSFIWSGDQGSKKVVVFVDNPCSGMRGGLEAMFLWNLIDSGVYRSRKQTPNELIEYIQSEIYLNYSSAEIRKGMKDIGVVVLFHEKSTNQIFYSVIDSVAFIGNSLDQKIINGLNPSYSETILSANGTSMINGNMIVEPGMKMVMTNKKLLNALNINSDDEIFNSSDGMGLILEHDLATVEKKLRIKIKKSCKEDSVFLQCLEF
ncbi:MAG: hypothetical protein HKN45_09930 [Flavobacteriales bacterium]|nr:hypothetical protein [Flavobacteriales bacterium]